MRVCLLVLVRLLLLHLLLLFFFFFFFIFFLFEEMAHDVTVEATLRVKGVGSSTKAVFVILKEVAGVPEV